MSKILGKTVKKDEKSDKLTCVKLWGLDGAKKKAKEHYDKCISLLNCAENSWFLIKYTDKIVFCHSICVSFYILIIRKIFIFDIKSKI